MLDAKDREIERLAKRVERARKQEQERCAKLVAKACPVCGHLDLGDHVKGIEQVGEDDWAQIQCECSAIAKAIRDQ